MASMRDIKRRRDSIQSTGQITKAMKLVSTVKLQKAKGNLNAGSSEKKAVIVITANRGLAGGYNSNITKLVTNGDIRKEDALIYAIGRKGREVFDRKGYTIKADYSDVIDNPMYTDAKQICDEVLKAFTDGEIGEIYLAYTSFKNTVVHVPTLIKLLPVDKSLANADNNKQADTTPMNYEPEEGEALDMIIPKYVCSLIYGALVEAVASENGARMQAMDNATSNAEEMISDLSLKYNRARQGSITQELTEIIAGANAIE